MVGSGQNYSASLSRYSLTAAVPTAELLSSSALNLSATNASMPGLAKNGSMVFGNANVGGGMNNAILATQNGTTTVLTQTSPVGLTSTFAANASHVYIGNMRISVTGGSMSTFVPHSIPSNALTVDASMAFFGSFGYWTDPPYTGSPDVAVASIFKTPL